MPFACPQNLQPLHSPIHLYILLKLCLLRCNHGLSCSPRLWPFPMFNTLTCAASAASIKTRRTSTRQRIMRLCYKASLTLCAASFSSNRIYKAILLMFKYTFQNNISYFAIKNPASPQKLSSLPMNRTDVEGDVCFYSYQFINSFSHLRLSYKLQKKDDNIIASWI